MLRVLIVDDDQLSRDILLRLLHHFEIEAESASSGEEALKIAAEKVFDLAILDLAMPQIDGWQLFKELQVHGLRAVAISAFYDPQVAREAKNAGFLACFPKPAN